MLIPARALTAVFGLCLLGASTGAASATRYSSQGGCDTSFSTCSALAETSYGSVGTGRIAGSWMVVKQVAGNGVKGAQIGFGHIQAPGIGCSEPSNCIGGPGEPPIVTPEPVTMALVASGLAGMGGIGLVRRRREQRGR